MCCSSLYLPEGHLHGTRETVAPESVTKIGLRVDCSSCLNQSSAQITKGLGAHITSVFIAHQVYTQSSFSQIGNVGNIDIRGFTK